jgi:hypothetical protein
MVAKVSVLPKGSAPLPQLASAVGDMGNAARMIEALLNTHKYHGRDLVDLAAQVRAIKSLLEDKIDKRLTMMVSEAITNTLVLDGLHMTACKQVSARVIPNTEKLKEYLGVQWPSFTREIPIVSIVYKAKA